MQKARLREKLIIFQKRLLDLTSAAHSGEKRSQVAADGLFLELFDVLDAFENVFASLAEKDPPSEKSMQRALQSFQAIHRKLLRLLAERDVTRIELQDNKAQVALCHIVESKEVDDQEEGTVLAVIKNGYRCGERVLRPVEVVTVAHKKEASEP